MPNTVHQQIVPIERLVESKTLLRFVDKESVDYLELKDSIAEYGVLQPICVRPIRELADAQGDKYEVVLGNHRYQCCKDLGLREVPCVIRDATVHDVLLLQIQENAVRLETRPFEYAKCLQKIMAMRPDLTMVDLANLIHKSQPWLSCTLGLLGLKEPIQKMVARGEINLSNAYHLSRFPVGWQMDYVNEAQAMGTSEFRQLAAIVLKKFKEKVRAGRLSALFDKEFNEFKPTAYLRPLKELQREKATLFAAPDVLLRANAQTPLDGWKAAIDWVQHLDSESIEEQERKHTTVLERQHLQLIREVTAYDVIRPFKHLVKEVSEIDTRNLEGSQGIEDAEDAEGNEDTDDIDDTDDIHDTVDTGDSNGDRTGHDGPCTTAGDSDRHE